MTMTPCPAPNKTSLPKISLTSYILGIISGAALLSTFTTFSTNRFSIYSLPPLPIYIITIQLFHFLEFFITSIYQPARITDNSFILDNPAYHLAHLFSLLEYFLESYFYPNYKHNTKYVPIQYIGISIIIFSQFIRSLSMITARQNFSHIIKKVKEKDHILIKHGIYAYLRHPAYFGFYYWALGTQLLLLNPVSFVLFAYLVHSFFNERIPFEEYHLIKFFGDEYRQYRKKTTTGIPFIRKLI